MSDAGGLIALYGTLMRGCGAQERLGIAASLEFVGPCLLSGALVELGWYPGLVVDDRVPAGPVVGELHRILGDGLLDVLDRYEGPEYERVRRRLREPAVEAWVYRFTGPIPDGARIESGDWRAHVAGVSR